MEEERVLCDEHLNMLGFLDGEYHSEEMDGSFHCLLLISRQLDADSRSAVAEDECHRHPVQHRNEASLREAGGSPEDSYFLVMCKGTLGEGLASYKMSLLQFPGSSQSWLGAACGNVGVG